MEDRLARRGTRVEDPAELAAALGVSDLLRNRGHLGEHLWRCGSERSHIRLVPNRHHQNMHRGLRRDVSEGDHSVGPCHDVAGDLARDNPAEDAIRHGPSLGAGVSDLASPLVITMATMSAEVEHPRKEWHELTAVILLSVVAVLTAWCGFESSKWGGEMSIAFSQASSNRVKASDAASASRDAFQLDVTVFAQWLVAENAGDEEFAAYLKTLFSDELDVAFVAWDGKTRTPFGLPEYVPAGTEAANEFTKQADEAYARALANNQRGDNYALLTVMFALVLFLTAMSQRRGPEWAQRALLFVGLTVAIAGVVILATFPVRI